MTYHIYCDETSLNSRFLGFGGVIIPLKKIHFLEEDIVALRKKYGMNSELKWTKCNSQKSNFYTEFIELFFKYRFVRFHSVFFERSEIDHKTFSEGDREIGFYKFYYQLLLHTFSGYCNSNESKIIIRPDKRTTKYKLEDLRRILNNGFKKKTSQEFSPFKSIEPIDSKSSNIVQLNDVLLGGLAYQVNDLNVKEDANRGKVDISNRILDRAEIRDPKINSPRSISKFTIWHFDLKKNALKSTN